MTVSSKSIQTLDAARQAYSNLLNDEKNSKAVEEKILRIDSNWYPERGRILYIGARNTSGVPRLVVAANRRAKKSGVDFR